MSQKLSQKIEKRRQARKQFAGDDEALFLTIELQGNINQQVRVQVVDISAGGLGLYSEEQLNVGQQIFFVDRLSESEMRDSGVVVWTIQSKTGFRAGIMFS